MCASGELPARYIKVESEHSAMAACMGASATGARAFTATSSQGLALMHELLHWAAGARHPIVMAKINRALGRRLEHLDRPERQPGAARHRLDPALLRDQPGGPRHHRPGLPPRRGGATCPSCSCLDAFYLSHTSEPVDIPDQEQVDALPAAARRRRSSWTPRDPAHLRRAWCGPTTTWRCAAHMQQAMAQAQERFAHVEQEWARALRPRATARVECYRTEDAELLLVTIGHDHLAPPGTSVDARRETGRAGGAGEDQAVPAVPHRGAARGAARRRPGGRARPQLSPGHGGIFAAEIRSALYDLPTEDRPALYGYVLGLGGRDVTPAVLDEVIEHARARGTAARRTSGWG